MSSQYPDPSKVLSPKWAVKSVRVIEDQGVNRHSVARLMYEDKSIIACRWNGGEGEPHGHPNSRGIPTWFVLPDSIAKDVLSGIVSRARQNQKINREIDRLKIECDLLDAGGNGVWLNILPLSSDISMIEANLIAEAVYYDDDFKEKSIYPFDTDPNGYKSINPIKSLNNQLNITLYRSAK